MSLLPTEPELAALTDIASAAAVAGLGDSTSVQQSGFYDQGERGI